MNTPLEKRYRRLLVTYPRAYRSQRGDEIISTVMDSSDLNQQWPAWREAGSLLVGGLRTRAWVRCGTTIRGTWLQGVRAATYYLLCLSAGVTVYQAMSYGGHSVGVDITYWTAALLAVAAFAGMVRDRIGLAFGTSLTSAIITTAVARILSAGKFTPTFQWLSWEGFLSSLTMLTLLFVLLRNRESSKHAHSWWWTLAPTLFFARSLAETSLSPYVTLLISVMLVVLALVIASVDPRPAITAALLLAKGALTSGAAVVGIARLGGLTTHVVMQLTAIVAIYGLVALLAAIRADGATRRFANMS